MGENDDFIAVSLRDLVLDYGEYGVKTAIEQLKDNTDYLEDLHNRDKVVGGVFVELCMSLREVLLEVIPSGLGVDNFYVVSFSDKPAYILTMMTFPYQTY